MTRSRHRKGIALFQLVAMFMIFGFCADGLATGLFSSADVEKPNPGFTQDKGRITAKFIPRAKSTSVTIQFQVTAGGTLVRVTGVDFAAVDRPEVDIKNFKSAAFDIEIGDVAPGGTATVAIRSDFFSLSTAYYIFNPKRGEPWIKDAQSENRALPQRVRELIVNAQDGGDFDADGQADGRISLVGGPRDSFWGYALGTLFIRFFGIFIVLCVLMIGMILSGRVFRALDRRSRSGPAAVQDKTEPAAEPPPAARPAGQAPDTPAKVPEAAVAAIAAALYLKDHELPMETSGDSNAVSGTAWSLAGRQRIMNDRLMVFERLGRNKV